MSEWYEKAYLGGGPVQVPFPRPLYPPDAANHGKKPSVDAEDVKAYKRALCRGGRWGEWNPSSWDDTYSNGFAHGKGGNVKDTGVAGFQRQMDIDDTGWWGEKSFNSLRYALISDPSSPHYREPLLDGECVRLLNVAFDRFGGHEPDTSGSTLRKAALQKAVSQIGVKESPPDSNHVKYCDWYGMTGPWCAMFVSWCFEQAGGSPSFQKGVYYSYVPYIVADARSKRNGLKTVSVDDAIAGDLVCYDWDWNGEFDHIGIFEKWSGNEMLVIEGNTSTSNNSNGGQVMRRDRLPSTQATVFVRVAEP